MPSCPVPVPRLRSGAARPTRVCAVAAAWACAAGAFAQQPPSGPGGPDETSWGLGLAAVGMQPAYKRVDREIRALPLLSVENRYLKLSGPNLELKLPGMALGESQRLNFGAVTQLFGGDGYKAGDSPALAGMAERKSSVWAGAKMEWENDVADLKLEWLGDASGKSKGQRLVLGLERKWMLGPSLMLVPQVGIEWMDRKYVDYYYGVRTSEATAGRAAYAGKATASPEISLTGIYRFDPQQSLMLNVGVRSLGREIRNSPIVGRSTESRVMLGYLYRFR